MAPLDDGGSVEERIRQEIAAAAVRLPVVQSVAETLDSKPGDRRVILSLNKKTLITLVALLLTVLAGTLVYAYASPYLTIGRVRRAAAAGDADTVNAHVDFPALRESIKGWMGVAMAQHMARSDMKNNPFAGVGAALATMMLDGVVTAMVTPETVRMMLEGQRPQPRRRDGSQREPTPPSDTDMEMGYESYDRFIVKVRDMRKPTNEFTMVWHRTGFTWKLSAIRLPMRSPALRATETARSPRPGRSWPARGPPL
jgi:hypothetical protein